MRQALDGVRCVEQMARVEADPHVRVMIFAMRDKSDRVYESHCSVKIREPKKTLDELTVGAWRPVIKLE